METRVKIKHISLFTKKRIFQCFQGLLLSSADLPQISIEGLFYLVQIIMLLSNVAFDFLIPHSKLVPDGFDCPVHYPPPLNHNESSLVVIDETDSTKVDISSFPLKFTMNDTNNKGMVAGSSGCGGERSRNSMVERKSCPI